MQKILGYMRKAIEDYNMIEEGDKIGVALSGGKDSIAMLMGFKNLQRFYPKKFDLVAINIDPGFDNFDHSILENICKKIDVTLIIEPSDIKAIVFDVRKEKNPCSLCANLRRGILNSVAIREKCNKLALGHNEDDVLQTFFLNLIYNGNISTFSPYSYMDRSNITLIRPLIYAPEKEIRKFIKRNDITVMPKVCPMDGTSKREEINDLIKDLNKKNPHITANIMGAIKRNHIPGWDKIKKEDNN